MPHMNGRMVKKKKNQKKAQIKLTRLSRQHTDKLPFSLLCLVAHSLFGNYLAELPALLSGTLISDFFPKHLASHELLTRKKKPVASTKQQPSQLCCFLPPCHVTTLSPTQLWTFYQVFKFFFFFQIFQIH